MFYDKVMAIRNDQQVIEASRSKAPNLPHQREENSLLHVKSSHGFPEARGSALRKFHATWKLMGLMEKGGQHHFHVI